MFIITLKKIPSKIVIYIYVIPLRSFFSTALSSYFSWSSSVNYFLFMLLISVLITFGRTPLLVNFGNSKLMKGKKIFYKKQS